MDEALGWVSLEMKKKLIVSPNSKQTGMIDIITQMSPEGPMRIVPGFTQI